MNGWSDDDGEWRRSLRDFGGPAMVIDVVQHASRAIMEIYRRDGVDSVEKQNGSPVTEADLCAAAIIEKSLREHSDIPVICEESENGLQEPGRFFWLVDPLDGTKEFINRNGEFTVNVGLVYSNRPVLGVIGVPVTGEVYVGVRGEGANLLKRGESFQVFNRRSATELIAAGSRSHADPAMAEYLARCGVHSLITCGSALKFCRLAQGVCDLYVRFGRTMEWDTGAGQCILEESGCKIFEASTGEPLRYGKAGFSNPSFIACRGDLTLPLSGPGVTPVDGT